MSCARDEMSDVFFTGFQMKDEDFQLDATEDKNNLLNSMFTGTDAYRPNVN